MKICLISDTHFSLPEIKEESDLLLHCGDISCGRSVENQFLFIKNEFYPWLDSLPIKNKVFIAGNHDWLFEKNMQPSDVPHNCHYLQDSSIEINGLKIYGSPWTPYYFNWAFNSNKHLLNTEEDLIKIFDKIPLDVDILMTHGPPRGILDETEKERWGSVALLNKIKTLQNLKLHCFGHMHENETLFEWNNIKFINCALSNNENKLTKNPIYIEI
jgi:Icc-related predicted phosphoesterase